jgi:hypothetical protein
MLSAKVMRELETTWLPNTTDAGLNRLIDLLEHRSPLLIHGSFTGAMPMGCLATHIAWHHPRTQHLTQEAGISWLTAIAGLNPATSQVIREWDYCGPHDWRLRGELLALLKAERERRQRRETEQPAEDAADLLPV